MEVLNIITPLLSLLVGSGATWLFTIKYDRKRAEAGAMEQVQTVYQQMISDLNQDRQRLEQEIGKIKEELSRLEQRMTDRERKLQIARQSCCAKARTCAMFESLEKN